MKRKKIGTKEGRNGEKCRMRRTLREDWKLFARGFGIICKTSPQYLAYNILFLIMNILSPYFALYMSAALVNELATVRRETLSGAGRDHGAGPVCHQCRKAHGACRP